jgi:hydrogenase assembly chaperone HypC/HupF
VSDVDRTCELASTGGRNTHSHCITCGDDGVPMRVVRIDAARELALCEDDAGARTSVETALVAPVAPGDRLLVHAGTALTRLDLGRPEADPSPSRHEAGSLAEVTSR